MSFLKKHKIWFLFPLLCLFGVILYIASTPTIYLAKSQVALFRMKIENPEFASDEGRNRWIWVRDGLNIQSSVLSNEDLLRFIQTSSRVASATKHLPNDSSKVGFVRGLVSVQFTGADENNYIIDVKSSDPELALELNQHLFARIRYLAIEKSASDFKKVYDDLKSRADQLPAKSAESQFYYDRLFKMKFEHELEQSQRELAFQVIQDPHVVDKPIWPKKVPLLLVSILIGFFLAYSVSFLKTLKN